MYQRKEATCLIISMTNLYAAPYHHHYLNCISAPCDLIYWNRDGADEPRLQGVFSRIFPYRHVSPIGRNLPRTGLNYIRFAHFVKGLLKQRKYERVVLLHQPLAVLLQDVLKREYPGRYLLDIRDYFYEDFPLYRRLFADAVRCAGLSVLSSRGYEAFLPPACYELLHNIRWLDGEPRPPNPGAYKKAPGTKVLTVGNIGAIRAMDRNLLLMDALGGDPRFRLLFAGTGTEALLPHRQAKGYENICIEGRFALEETPAKFEQADLVYNLFGCGRPHLDFALSNKLYYAAQLGRPILVSPGTYIEKIAGEHGLGIGLSLRDPHFADRVYSYYQGLHWPTFWARCDGFLKAVEADNEKALRHIRAFLNI